MESLIVSANRIDRLILEQIKEELESTGISTITMTEIIHISLFAYNWSKNAFNASFIMEKLTNKLSNFPVSMIIVLFSPTMEYNGYYPECIKRDNIVLFSLGNIRKRYDGLNFIDEVRDRILDYTKKGDVCSNFP
ncbi:hypothetical protein [Metallosphaera hakonensis]|uniref:Uncharacterized protein n=1 Tax=Metallosphaera hakonensis JCM 8857 = DSM 7519 TaxID=1293036 RepID=A0A2U9ITS5_9CREN|nr:hypothetical protein [Metallosphaera hakonensis]AWR99382.1 hypothetical protein DFR87_06325 [Metallosphaera hakonensis JCM 8857 = DSM 7519]